MPVQYSYISTPLWVVLLVKTLIAFTVQLYLYSPYEHYGIYTAQCLYSTAIPLLCLWAVRPVHTLSACTVQL